MAATYKTIKPGIIQHNENKWDDYLGSFVGNTCQLF